jgi:hypothetical protein
MGLTKKIRKVKATETASQPVDNGFKKLKILVTVVNRRKTELFMDLLSAYEINFQTAVLAQGTAKDEMLYMLGLEDSDKSVIFSVLREDKVADAMHMLEEKFHSIKDGKGIAFTIPMSSVVGVAIYRFLSNHRQ